MPLSEAPDWRLFIALPLPAEAATAVENALLPYVAAFPAARWLPASALHVTLRFLGATPPDQVGPLGMSVDLAAQQASPSSVAPLLVTTDRGAGRARGGDGVAWLTIGAGRDRIAALAGRLGSLLSALPAVADAVARPAPEPHLTVARHADARLLEALGAMALGPLGVAWQADRICLFRSTPSRGAASYQPLHEARLAGVA